MGGALTPEAPEEGEVVVKQWVKVLADELVSI